jgi:hypothetical protein
MHVQGFAFESTQKWKNVSGAGPDTQGAQAPGKHIAFVSGISSA